VFVHREEFAKTTTGKIRRHDLAAIQEGRSHGSGTAGRERAAG